MVADLVDLAVNDLDTLQFRLVLLAFNTIITLQTFFGYTFRAESLTELFDGNLTGA
jgi:hypothetical protein